MSSRRHTISVVVLGVVFGMVIVVMIDKCRERAYAQPVSLIGIGEQPVPIGMCGAGATAFLIRTVEHETREGDPFETVLLYVAAGGSVAVYGEPLTVPLMHELTQPEFDVRLVRRTP